MGIGEMRKYLFVLLYTLPNVHCPIFAIANVPSS